MLCVLLLISLLYSAVAAGVPPLVAQGQTNGLNVDGDLVEVLVIACNRPSVKDALTWLTNARPTDSPLGYFTLLFACSREFVCELCWMDGMYACNAH